MVSVNYWLSKYYLAKNRTHEFAAMGSTDELSAINNILVSRVTLIKVILAVQNLILTYFLNIST